MHPVYNLLLATGALGSPAGRPYFQPETGHAAQPAASPCLPQPRPWAPAKATWRVPGRKSRPRPRPDTRESPGMTLAPLQGALRPETVPMASGPRSPQSPQGSQRGSGFYSGFRFRMNDGHKYELRWTCAGVHPGTCRHEVILPATRSLTTGDMPTAQNSVMASVWTPQSSLPLRRSSAAKQAGVLLGPRFPYYLIISKALS